MSEQSSTPSTRASDADRARAAEHLATALSEGRLDLAEYEERTRRALAATTLGDLASVTADLPAPVVDHTVAEKAAKRQEFRTEWGYWAGGAVVMTGVWGVTSFTQGELKLFWPLAPLVIWGLILIAEMIWADRR
ncbi:DUF1707 domain-containing protein [Umezawaea endophytica]|uniref:DUF1707 domain-containing protein n=1 Tax=Umezawaea endophytica TaxID=1654476 RepID=A0A9X3AFX0_9PSEU|nr:DUF1707 domain-containing protein [Umezawaea endophytica]MCS7478861.1 DUF1707 domain-containing protein [Umezawaea endophytica]